MVEYIDIINSSAVIEKSWRALRIRKKKPKFEKNKILILYLGYNDMVKKPSRITVPLKTPEVTSFRRFTLIAVTPATNLW